MVRRRTYNSMLSSRARYQRPYRRTAQGLFSGMKLSGNCIAAAEAGARTEYQSNSLNQYTEEGDFCPEFDAAGNQTLICTSTGEYDSLRQASTGWEKEISQFFNDSNIKFCKDAVLDIRSCSIGNVGSIQSEIENYSGKQDINLNVNVYERNILPSGVINPAALVIDGFTKVLDAVGTYYEEVLNYIK